MDDLPSRPSEAFNRFLDWLDDSVPSDGASYLAMRGRLVGYFDRKGCRAPDELADDTLSRVSRRLEEEGEINTAAPAKYCYTVARFVFLESLRAHENRNSSLGDSVQGRKVLELAAVDRRDEVELRERLLGCLDTCVEELGPSNKDLIVRYYHGEEKVKIDNRRSIAADLGISINALSIRACRIRDKLEACVKKCAG